MLFVLKRVQKQSNMPFNWHKTGRGPHIPYKRYCLGCEFCQQECETLYFNSRKKFKISIFLTICFLASAHTENLLSSTFWEDIVCILHLSVVPPPLCLLSACFSVSSLINSVRLSICPNCMISAYLPLLHFYLGNRTRNLAALKFERFTFPLVRYQTIRNLVTYGLDPREPTKCGSMRIRIHNTAYHINREIIKFHKF
jgi:ferredoxin